jgi:hypothetical protein
MKYSLNALEYGTLLSWLAVRHLAPRVLEINMCSYAITWLPRGPERDPARAWATLRRLHEEYDGPELWKRNSRDGLDYIAVKASRLGLELPMQPQQVTPVRMVHGDATMENFLEGGLAIDPGHPRGLVYAETDRGKLLQSLLCHWEVVKRGWEPYHKPIPFEVMPTDVFMLWAHLVRLLNHTELHSHGVLEYARHALAKVHAFIRDANSVRYGWRAVRLERLRAELLRESVARSARLRLAGEYEPEGPVDG